MGLASAKLWQIFIFIPSAIFLQKEFLYLWHGKELFYIVHLAAGDATDTRTADLERDKGALAQQHHQ